MKKLFLYFKLQYILLITLTLICVVPYTLNQTLFNKLIPNLHLIFIIMLFAIKLLLNDSKNRASLKKHLRQKLLKETGKVPSNKEIEQRVTDLINAKDIVLIAVGLTMLILFIVL